MSRDLHDLRRYTRRHLYSAVHITARGYDRANRKDFCGTGTGFFIEAGTRLESFHLVTARHVLDPDHADPGAGLRHLESITVRGVRTHRHQDDTEFEFTFTPEHVAFHPDDDIDLAVVHIEPDSKDAGSVFGVAMEKSDIIKPHVILADDVGVGTEIVMVGYPRLENGVGYRPLLVPGIVSSDLRYDADYGGNRYPGRGICHSFSRGGMSGAPVLTAVMQSVTWDDDGPREPAVRLLGINTGHPREKDRPEALSLFVPATALAPLIDDDLDQLYQRIASSTADMAGIVDTTKLNRALQLPRGTVDPSAAAASPQPDIDDDIEDDIDEDEDEDDTGHSGDV